MRLDEALRSGRRFKRPCQDLWIDYYDGVYRFPVEELLADDYELEPLPEPEPLKLEVGKLYRMRNGNKAEVIAYRSTPSGFSFMGCIEGGFGEPWQTWRQNGSSTYEGCDRNGQDLIAPWPDEQPKKKTVKKWLALRVDSAGHYFIGINLYATVEDAQADPGSWPCVRLLTEYPAIEVEVDD